MLHDALPRSRELASFLGHHFVRLDVRPAVGEIGEQRAEQLELAARALLRRLVRARLDLREHVVDVIGLARQLREALIPRLEILVLVLDAIDRLPEFHEPPDAQLVPMVVGRGLVEVVERGLVFTAVVENVAEIDAGLGVVAVELECAAQRRDRALVVAEPVLRVADARHGLGRVGRLLHRDVEEFTRVVHHPVAKERPPALQHQLDVVVVPQLEDATKALERGGLLAEPQQRLAEAGQRVLVIGVEHQRLLEAAARPGVLLAREPCISHSHVQLHRIRIQREPFAQHVQRLVVLPLVVQLMRALVVLFRTQERAGHRATILRLERYA